MGGIPKYGHRQFSNYIPQGVSPRGVNRVYLFYLSSTGVAKTGLFATAVARAKKGRLISHAN
jgi:hypothetical protein